MGLGPLGVGKGLAAPRLLKILVLVALVLFRIGQAVFDDVIEAPNEALDGPSGSVSESANGVTLNRPANLFEHWHFLGICLARLDAFEDALHPPRPLAAGGALATRLVLVEVRQAADSGDHVHRLVKDGHCCGSETRALGL